MAIVPPPAPPGMSAGAPMMPPAAPFAGPPSPALSQPTAPPPNQSTPTPPVRNQAVKATTTDEDREMIARVRGLFSEARHQRKPIVAKWNRFYRSLRNRTWVSPSSYYPAPEVPEMLPIVEALVGWLTDQRPTFDVIPALPPFSDLYDELSAMSDDLRVALNVNWAQYDHETVVELVVRDAYIYGLGVFKSLWDNTVCDGLGDAVMRRVDPYTFFPDPGATSFADANYFIEARRMSIQEVDRRFPGAAKKLAESRYNDTIDERPNLNTYTEAPKANPGAISPSTAASYGRPGQGRESVYIDNQGVTVLECWLREHTVDMNAADTPVVHDDWRCVVIAGPHVLLNEKASDILPFPRHPYEPYYTFDSGELFGVSMVELLLPSQIAINRLLAALQHNVELIGNPVLVESQRAGIQRTTIANRPGQRLTINDGGQVDWLKPPTMSSDISGLIQFYIGEMERISGLSAITRGMGPGGRNAASVIDSLQEASFVRVRMASRQMERTLRNVGQRLAAFMAAFYTEPRMVSLLGQNGERTVRALQSMHWYIPGEDGSAPFRFQLQVQAGSSLPTSRQARSAEADTMFALGTIDLMSYLQAKNWPNAQQVYQRKMAEMQAMAGAEQPDARTAARA